MSPFLTCSPLPHPLHRNAIRSPHRQPHRRWIWAIYAALKLSKNELGRQAQELILNLETCRASMTDYRNTMASIPRRTSHFSRSIKSLSQHLDETADQFLIAI